MTPGRDQAGRRQAEMLATIVAALPFSEHEEVRVIDVAAGGGRLSEAVLDVFPAAKVVAFEASERLRAAIATRTTRFSDRIQVRPFALDTLDWWDVMFGADAVVSAMAVHQLNDAKKQYLYKAAADRLSDRGALVIGDAILPLHPASQAIANELADRDATTPHDATADVHPSAIFHHLVWLKHAGFAAVDCVWLSGGRAVYAGYRVAEGRGVGFARALRAVRRG